MPTGELNRRLRKRKQGMETHVLVVIAGFIGLVIMCVILFVNDSAQAHVSNPKQGEVLVNDGIYKICDGRNLIYTVWGNGIAVSPDDPQCNRS